MMMDNPSPTFGMSQALRFDPAWPAARQKEAVLLMLECGLGRRDVAKRCGIGSDVLHHILTTRVQPIEPPRGAPAWHPDDLDDLAPHARRCLRLIGRHQRAGQAIVSARQAGELLGVPTGTMIKLLAQLNRNGLVQRTGPRSKPGIYSLTDAGVRALMEAAA